MTNALVVASDKNLSAVESALVMNDLSKLTSAERVTYVRHLCESLGLNYLTNPFMFITLQGKLTLYATRGSADQLRKIHGVSISIKSKEVLNGTYIVHVEGKDREGKFDEATGIVVIDGLKGNDLANAMMKAETKAKRRLTLSICGLGFPDESELDTIDNKRPADNPHLKVKNPFKDESSDDIPENSEREVGEAKVKSELGSFVCRVGKKYPGKTLEEIGVSNLIGFCESTKKWFTDNKKEMSPDWIEFFEAAEAYLCSVEVEASP